MKLKPGIVLLIAPLALSFGLWVDQMIAQETHDPARQQEIRIETVDQPNADNSQDKESIPTARIIAFM
jgi:hypothetical protein